MPQVTPEQYKFPKERQYVLVLVGPHRYWQTAQFSDGWFLFTPSGEKLYQAKRWHKLPWVKMPPVPPNFAPEYGQTQ